MLKELVTGRNEVVAKVIFLHLSVVLFTGGACLRQTPLWEQTPPQEQNPPEQTPLGQTPPRSDTPPGQTPPQVRHPLSRHPPKQTPPWEQTPGLSTPSPGTKYTPPGLSTPAPEGDSGIRSTSGRYASFWNAFLFVLSGSWL